MQNANELAFMLRTFASPRLPALVPSSSPCLIPLCRGRGRASSPEGAIEQQKVTEWGRVGKGVETLEVFRSGPEGAVAVSELCRGRSSSHASSFIARESVASLGPRGASRKSSTRGWGECEEKGCIEESLEARGRSAKWSTEGEARCRMRGGDAAGRLGVTRMAPKGLIARRAWAGRGLGLWEGTPAGQVRRR